MPQSYSPNNACDVTNQIFSRFLESLSNEGMSIELINQLRKILIEEKDYSERALKTAIIEEDQS